MASAAQDGTIVWASNNAINGSAFDTATEVCAFVAADANTVDIELILINGSDNAHVWFYDGGLDGAAAISVNDFVLIGILTGVNVVNLNAANFGAGIA